MGIDSGALKRGRVLLQSIICTTSSTLQPGLLAKPHCWVWAGAPNNRQIKCKWFEPLQEKTQAMTEAALEWQVWKQMTIKFVLCEVTGLGTFTPLVCTGELLIYLFLPPCIFHAWSAVYYFFRVYIYTGLTKQRFRYFQDMLSENILRRVRKGC